MKDLVLKTYAIICIHTIVNKFVFIYITFLSRDKWVLVTTACRVLRFWMEEQPPIWRVALNILNKQSQTADKGWSSSLGVGRVTNNLST